MATAEVHEHRAERTQKSVAPDAVRGAVRAGLGVGQMAHQIWLAGLGAMAATGEESTHLFQTLVKRGREVEPNLNLGWNKIRTEVTSTMRRAGEEVRSATAGLAAEQDQKLLSRLKRMKVPNHSEVEHLTRRVDELSARVEQMSRSRTPRTPSKKTAAASSRAGQARTRRPSARTSR